MNKQTLIPFRRHSTPSWHLHTWRQPKPWKLPIEVCNPSWMRVLCIANFFKKWKKKGAKNFGRCTPHAIIGKPCVRTDSCHGLHSSILGICIGRLVIQMRWATSRAKKKSWKLKPEHKSYDMICKILSLVFLWPLTPFFLHHYQSCSSFETCKSTYS